MGRFSKKVSRSSVTRLIHSSCRCVFATQLELRRLKTMGHVDVKANRCQLANHIELDPVLRSFLGNGTDVPHPTNTPTVARCHRIPAIATFCCHSCVAGLQSVIFNIVGDRATAGTTSASSRRKRRPAALWGHSHLCFCVSLGSSLFYHFLWCSLSPGARLFHEHAELTPSP